MLSHWRLAAAALGIGVAAFGQIVITSGRVFDYPVLTPLADVIFDMHRQPTAILLGVLLLAAGGAAFAASVIPEREMADLEGERPGLRALAGQEGRKWLFAGIIALGVAISAVLWLLLALGNYSDAYPLVWVLGIAVVAGAFLYLDRLSGVNLSLRIGLLEVAFLVIVIGAFFALNLRDLTNWYYSVIGDEYVYWDHARAVAEGSPRNFFSNFFHLRGVYDVLPVAETYYVAGVMKIFGTDYFAWRFASVLAGAAVFAPLYLLVRSLFGVRTAVTASVLLVAAHVMLAYAHAGYDALFALFPSVLAFALFFTGMKRGSALLIFGAGAAAGLGFYVFYPGRFILPVLLVLLFLYRASVDLKRDLAILLVGFALAAAPMVIVNNTDIISLMGRQSVFSYDPAIVPDPFERIIDNAFRSPLAFNYNEKAQHFISGSLLEPITAVLAVLGLVYALRRFRRPAFAFLLIWYGISMAASGVASPHPFVPMIRMSYLIPIMVIFAAVALGEAYGMVQGKISTSTLRTVAPAMALSIVALAVVGSNVYRFLEVTPEDVRNTPGAVVMKAVLSEECSDGGGQRVIVAPHTGGSLGFAVASRDWDGVPPVMLAYDELERVQEFSPTSCVVYRLEGATPSEGDLRRLQQLEGKRQRIPVYDDAGEQLVIVLK